MVEASAVLSPAAPPASPASAGAVVVRDLRRIYGSVTALDGINLDVRPGELLAVLGPSGCGKTTLLRLIAGFERPDAGTVAIDGAVVAGPERPDQSGRRGPERPDQSGRRGPERPDQSGRRGTDVYVPPERRRVGIVVQDHALFPHLTVAANVGYGIGRRHAGRAARVAEALELVGLENLGERFPADLSGGQQQRVALARALAPRPRVVLLDEPFANLDAALRTRLRLEVRRILKAAEATVVLVTHDQEEALSLADRIAVMDAGRVLQVGEPHEVYRSPVDPFVARFVGESALVAARSDGDGLETPLGRLAVAGDAPRPGPALAVLRPDILRLTPDAGTAPSGGARGTVVAAAYFGHDQLVDVTLDAAITLRARLGSERRFAPGDRVLVDVADAVVAFPA